MKWKRVAAVFPAIGAALAPKLTCPMCWPAYSAVLGALGLGFLVSERYLLALTAAFSVLALAALAFRASERRGYGPAALGLFAIVLTLAGKFALNSLPLRSTGVALLLFSSVWSSLPRRAATPCPKCVPSSSEPTQWSAQKKSL